MLFMARSRVGSSDELRGLFESRVGVMDKAEIAPLGLPSRILAVASRELGERDRALSYFDTAISISREHELRMELARNLADSAEVLRERDEDGDIAEAERREDEALTVAGELGMRPLTERILARRDILKD